MLIIKSRYIGLVIILLMFLLLSGCNKKIEDTSSLLEYINDADNGLLKTKSVNNLEIEVKFLPKQYIEKKEFQISDDETKKSFADSEYIVFLLSIKPKDDQNNSVIYDGLTDYQEYKSRVYDMNFSIEEQIYLKAENQQSKPIFSFFENIYNLKPGIDVLLVFSPVEESQKNMFSSDILEFVYEDEEFGLGINHFYFNREDINDLHKKL